MEQLCFTINILKIKFEKKLIISTSYLKLTYIHNDSHNLKNLKFTPQKILNVL